MAIYINWCFHYWKRSYATNCQNPLLPSWWLL